MSVIADDSTRMSFVLGRRVYPQCERKLYLVTRKGASSAEDVSVGQQDQEFGSPSTGLHLRSPVVFLLTRLSVCVTLGRVCRLPAGAPFQEVHDSRPGRHVPGATEDEVVYVVELCSIDDGLFTPRESHDCLRACTYVCVCVSLQIPDVVSEYSRSFSSEVYTVTKEN